MEEEGKIQKKKIERVRCARCLADVPAVENSCPKCGFPLPIPVKDGPLRDSVKFSFIAPLYSKPRLVYDSEGLLVAVETEFRLYKALKEAKQPPLIIYDADGYVNPKRHEYALVKLDANIVAEIAKVVPAKIWSKLLASYDINRGENEDKHPAILLWEAGVLVAPVPRLRNVEFLRGMNWRDFIDGIICFKGVEIDPRLKLVRLTHLMRGLKQPINPHALIVLPGQTGKSEWYRYVGVLEDKVSPNSLIGYADADGPKPGSIDGSELPFALDQIESSGMHTIFRYMLGLMEVGEARVDTAAYPFDIYSASVFAILSNPIGEAKSNFAVLLEKLSKNPALGRRFGIILYDKDAVRIKRREKDLELIHDKVALFRAVEEYCLPELRKILNDERVWSWLNTRNEEFVRQTLRIIEPVENDDENLYLFLREFIENGGSHTRGGALRAALALNLDKIAIKEYIIEEILTEAEEILSDLLKINFESVRLIAATFQETKEQGDLRAFDMLPTYMKEIVSAVELWRRNLTEEERSSLRVPLSFRLNTLDYKPETEAYFSKVLDAAWKGNPEKYNESLKAHFQLEIKKERDGLVAVVYSVYPVPYLKVFGNFANFGNFEDIRGKGVIEQKEVGIEEFPPSNSSKFPKIPKITKEGEATKPQCIVNVARLTCLVVGKCSMCGFNGRMSYQVNLKSGAWTCLCEECGRLLENAMREAS
ncbi:MAG: hypothetical protein QW175_05750 [Candidatus Bathyarchaeia archaeon]